MESKIKLLIIKTAKSLFRNQGYEQTTIRQLLSSCHITTGTLYKYFDNKKAIFEAVRKDDILKLQNIISRIIKNNNEPLLIVSVDIRILLTLAQRYERYAESILSYYDHYDRSEQQINDIIHTSQLCFIDYNEGLTDEDFRDRALIFKGIYRSFISDFLLGFNSDLDSKANLIIQTIYSLYNVPKKEVERICNESIDIISNNQPMLIEFLN